MNATTETITGAVLNAFGKPSWRIDLPKKVSSVRIAAGLAYDATINLQTFDVSFKAKDVEKAFMSEEASRTFITTEELESTGDKYYVFKSLGDDDD